MNMTECGPLTYQALAGLGPLPSPISFSSETRSLSVYTKDPNAIGTYAIAITAVTQYYYSDLGTPTITVPVYISCVPYSISISVIIPDKTIVLGSQ